MRPHDLLSRLEVHLLGQCTSNAHSQARATISFSDPPESRPLSFVKMDILRKLAYFCCFGTTTPLVDEEDSDLFMSHLPPSTIPATTTPQILRTKKIQRYADFRTSTPSCPNPSTLRPAETEILGIPLDQLEF